MCVWGGERDELRGRERSGGRGRGEERWGSTDLR